MTMKLDPKEKLADADREQKAAQAAFQSASDRLQQFDREHATLDAKLREDRSRLELAQARALEELREKQQILTFMHHEIYAMDQGWGRSSAKWFRGDKKHEDRGREDL
jgi:hypothetical protein